MINNKRQRDREVAAKTHDDGIGQHTDKERQINRQTGKQIDRQKDAQRDKQADRQADVFMEGKKETEGGKERELLFRFA